MKINHKNTDIGRVMLLGFLLGLALMMTAGCVVVDDGPYHHHHYHDGHYGHPHEYHSDYHH